MSENSPCGIALFQTIVYIVWEVRNKAVFNGRPSIFEAVLNRVVALNPQPVVGGGAGACGTARDLEQTDSRLC